MPSRRKISRPLVIGSLVAAVLVGLAFGLGGFTFTYAKGSAYLGSDPAACANCHVMQEYYDAWLHSSHRAVAGCNDCHTPNSFVPKYFVKALNGWNHSVAFTTGNFHEPIRANKLNHDVAEAQCRSCHGAIVEAIDLGHPNAAEEGSCIRCHGTVGHPLR